MWWWWGCSGRVQLFHGSDGDVRLLFDIPALALLARGRRSAAVVVVHQGPGGGHGRGGGDTAVPHRGQRLSLYLDDLGGRGPGGPLGRAALCQKGDRGQGFPHLVRRGGWRSQRCSAQEVVCLHAVNSSSLCWRLNTRVSYSDCSTRDLRHTPLLFGLCFFKLLQQTGEIGSFNAWRERSRYWPVCNKPFYILINKAALPCRPP